MSNEIYLTPEQYVVLDKAVQECVGSNIRIEGERQLQKDIADRVQDEVGIKGADFRKLVSEVYQGKVSDAIEKAEAIIELKDKLDTAVKNMRA